MTPCMNATWKCFALIRGSLLELQQQEAPAIEDWIGLLGAEHVIREQRTLEAAGRATFETNVSVPVVLRPANVEQLRAVMDIAVRHRFPIYPISSGKNW